MPKPLESLLGAKARKTYDSIILRTFASTQYPEEQSPQQLSLLPDEPVADISSRPCPSCNLYQVREAAGSGCHHKSLVCANCDRWIKWLGNPKGEA